MPITIGNTTITGLTAGGLPNGVITADSLASGAVTSSKINFTGRVLQVQRLSSTTRTSMNPGNTLTEPSSNYRVSITPQFSNSMIIIHYSIPMSHGTNWFVNSLGRVDARKWISGSQSAISSVGTALGSRIQIAGYSARSSNGHDLNDMNDWNFTVVDFPATTSTVQYGFRCSNEGGDMFFGYSRNNNSSWGWDSNINIIAMEIRQ